MLLQHNGSISIDTYSGSRMREPAHAEECDYLNYGTFHKTANIPADRHSAPHVLLGRIRE